MTKQLRHIFEKQAVLCLPFLLLAVAYAWKQASFQAYTGDDVAFFAAALEQQSLWQFVEKRFLTWTSRVLWEPITVLLLQGPAGVFLWRAGSVLCVVFLAWFAFRLAKRTQGVSGFFMACVSCIAIYYVPWSVLQQTGAVCSSMLYQWAAAACAGAALPLVLDEKKFRPWQIALCALACVWGANMEQLCVLMIFLMAGYTCYAVFAGRSWHYSALCLALCGAELLVHLLCPGNGARAAKEVWTWFGDYGMLSVPQKLEIAFSGTMYWTVGLGEVFWGCVYAALAVLCVKKGRGFVMKIPGPLLFGIWLFTGFLPRRIPSFPHLSFLLTTWGIITIETVRNLMAYIPFLLWAFAFILLVCTVYIVCGHTARSLLAVGLVLGGFGTRLMMGFSPTVWASEDRTFLVMHICMAMALTVCLAALPLRQNTGAAMEKQLSGEH